MKSMDQEITSIDGYIDQFEEPVRRLLVEVREAIRAVTPQATEKISYRIPTFYFNGNLVHFAAFKNHIGLYPASSGIDAFQEALAPYHTSKGAVQFPYEQPIPLSLIQDIVRFRLTENSQQKKNRTRASVSPS